MKTRKLVYMALLTACALAIFVAEAQIPAPVPVPGVKLGLANIITVYAVFTLGAGPALMIMLVRVVLGCLVTGQAAALIYSLSGGFLCWCAMLVMRRIVSLKQIWVSSVFGAVFHNIGQLGAAVLVTKTPQIIVYLPVLAASAVVTGLFTGLCAQLLVNRTGPHI